MRIIGILGGLGPESTIDYYRSILARYRARTQNDGYPQIIINSLDVDKGIASGTELALLLRDSEATPPTTSPAQLCSWLQMILVGLPAKKSWLAAASGCNTFCVTHCFGCSDTPGFIDADCPPFVCIGQGSVNFC